MEVKDPKSMKQPKSIEIVAAIDDLLTEILFRLPIEPLIRCKIVSKRWQSLISNPNFRRRRKLNPVPAAGLFFRSPFFRGNLLFEYVPLIPRNLAAVAPFRRLDFTRDPLGITIVQSCNGLLLCCSCWTTLTSAKFYVYNPTTGIYSTLPKPGGATSTHAMSLAFDPAISPPHYKVVCVRDLELVMFNPADYRRQIEVYSSKTGHWRTRGEPFATKLAFANGVYWNNAIHWIHKPYGEGDAIYFNVHRHVIEKMPSLPASDSEYGRDEYYYFGESCDHLHYIQLSGKHMQFNVYEMKRDYSEWFVKYNVDLSPVVDANYEMIRANFNQTSWCFFHFSVFCVVRGEEEDDSFLVLQVPGKVLRYNLVSKTLEKLHKFEDAEDAQVL